MGDTAGAASDSLICDWKTEMSVASQKLIARLNARLITRSDDGYVAVTAPRDEPAERDFQLGSVSVVSTPPKSTASREAISAEDETAITDIRIAPDGRVFVFGASG